MRTLILSPRYSEDSIQLLNSAIENGWQVERLLSWRAPEHLKNIDVAVYGEALFGAVLAQELDLYLLEPRFEWLSEIPYKFKLREVTFSDLTEARKLTDRSFIKPADDKNFKAAVYESGEELPDEAHLPGNIPVLISQPVSWDVEFRFFILDHQITTFSPYSRNGELIRDIEGDWKASDAEIAQANQFCKEVLHQLKDTIPPAVVIDIGKIVGKGWAIVEANPCWAAGIYGCDPSKVLNAISRACLLRDKIDEKDRKWIINREDYLT